MNPQDVVSPITLPPRELERFQRRWVIYLERMGITADRQPTAEEVREWCFVAGVPLPPDESAPESVVEELDRLRGSDEPVTPDADAEKPRSASPALTPEQEVLAKAPWTAEDMQAWRQQCALGMRGNPEIYPERYSAREITNFIRARRGVPLLPPDPPQEPGRWIRGAYQPWKYPIEDDSPQPGSFGNTERPGRLK